MSVTSYGPYTILSDKLWTPYTKLSDKLWTPYTNFSDNKHEDFEVKVKNEGENEVFQDFRHVHHDPEVILQFYIICVEINCYLIVPLDACIYWFESFDFS